MDKLNGQLDSRSRGRRCPFSGAYVYIEVLDSDNVLGSKELARYTREVNR